MKGTLADRFWAKVHKADGDGCWEWTARLQNKGYGHVYVPHGVTRGGTMRLAHRVSWELANGAVPAGMMVLHRCDVPSCVNPAHLFLGTSFDNMRDMVSKGRNFHVTHPETMARGDRSGARLHPEAYKRGADNANAKLTADQVHSIRAERTCGASLGSLSRRYGISKMHVRRLVRGESWRHVQ